jgi:ankyrin repeat protein
MSKNIFDYINDTTPFALQKCKQFLEISPNELYTIGEHNETALIKAVLEGKRGFVELFLEKNTKGAEFVNHKNFLGLSALHFAAHHGRTLDIESLMAAGANVEIMDDVKSTPLCSAVIMGQRGAAEALLKHGAKADYHSPIGSSTLLALGLKEEDQINAMLTLLLQYGGDPYDKGADDKYSIGDSVWRYLCNHDMTDLIGHSDSE